jgi:DNA-binding transcriptional MocR family regulator
VRWTKRARELGAHFEDGRAFTLDRAPLAGARLGFACLSDNELAEAVRRIAAAAARL